MTESEQKRLLVEGRDDLYAVANLLKRHIDWKDDDPPLEIIDCNGSSLLEGEEISVRLKSSDTKILGIVLDADGDCRGKWEQIRRLCLPHITNMPKALPREGLIVPSRQGRFGVWIMPDNRHPGMLETFLKSLVPEKHERLLSYAEMTSKRAKSRFGAPYGDTHYDKAVMRTWLAWMDPPGKPFGTAVKARMLDADACMAKPFLKWLRDLYEFNVPSD
ncbi:MAG: hypothetical protein LBI62_03585 [Candidatus Accumulibacter sp.]|jgi:hypothetical protein|nr:hypothetical protein [Accumulibacter sp.]